MSQTNPEEHVHCFPIEDGRTPSQATYLAVARATDRDPLDLPPLARAVDPDGLDAFVGASTDAEGPTSRFEYAGCHVTVTGEEVHVAVR